VNAGAGASAGSWGSRGIAWLCPVVPARRLAVVRIAVGVFAWFWLVGISIDLLARASFDPARFRPVGLAAWTGSVAPAVVATVLVATLVLGAAWVLGLRYRVLAPGFALGLAWLLSYRNSWGHLSHGEHLLVLHVAILSLAPAADALRVRGRDRDRRGERPPDDARYGWPLRLLVLVTLSTYAIAGLAKLRGGGWAWLSGDTVRLHVANEALRVGLVGGTVSPLAEWLVPYGWIFAIAAWGTVALEVGSPVALVGGRMRTAWICGTWAMHVGIAAVMGIVFTYPVSGVAFVGFVAAERGWERLERWRHRISSARRDAPRHQRQFD
jgi:hypothetical protein